MTVITTNEALKAALKPLKKAKFIAIDTEFMRERTYYSKLALIQLASDKVEAFAIDPLAEGMDLTPFYDLIEDEKILKVFHSCTQDVEIMFLARGKVPTPIFDTQIAAEVLGYGDSMSYASLVKKFCDKEIDKSSRFTDWLQRPLKPEQIAYALSDVTYLCKVYQVFAAELVEKGREEWMREEMARYESSSIYAVDPENAWKRIKTRGGNQKFLRAVKALAAWRESKAQEKDVPRGRVLKDEVLLEIAAAQPRTIEDMRTMRRLQSYNIEGKFGGIILEVLESAHKSREHLTLDREERVQGASGALVDLLKVLVKAKCEEHAVSQKMIARSDDLAKIAAWDEKTLLASELPAMHGWRFHIFGQDALRLKRGEISLSARGHQIKIIDVA